MFNKFVSPNFSYLRVSTSMLTSCFLALSLAACGSSNSGNPDALQSDAGSGDLATAGVDADGKDAAHSRGTGAAKAGASAVNSSETSGSSQAATLPAATLYNVQTLIDDASKPNDNGWWLNMNGDLTSDKNGPVTDGVQHYAYVSTGLRAADGKSHWPKKYLDNQGISGGSSIRYLAWSVMMDAFQAGNEAGNTRVQFRNGRIFVLYRDGRWETADSDDLARSPAEWGAWYSHFNGSPGTEATVTTSTGDQLHQGRVESASNGGGSSIGAMGYGNYGSWAFHGWPLAFAKSQAQLVNEVEGVVHVYEARLTLQDPNGPDDRSKANIMAWTGADWYNDSSGGSYVGEYNHGRVKLVRNDWQIFSSHDLPASVLRANPPPGFVN